MVDETSSMSPTLYDVLGVSRDASREEIRQAWREAADRFEPGQGGSTRQFRLFNEAAEVLLDPERREAYDTRLAAEEAERRPVEPAPARTTGEQSADQPTGEPSREKSAGATVVPDGSAGEAKRRTTVPWWALTLLGVVTAVVLGTTAYVVNQAQRTAAYEEALERAPAAAESAAVAVLSYDHESLESDRDAAARFLTEDYRKEYLETFDKTVRDTAAEVKATVEAEVLALAPMTVGQDRDPDRVSVLVFVDQTSTLATREQPSRALNRARFDMVEVDGTWLVDGITSY